ncbi:hypothetical protein [Bacteroides cellulosilyticus]|uniref:hypothetical protein n=1 Tax=Bacteroides cellulosilyticus TaxID=246787 RepID=UPI001C37DB5D|nr:hypothetical protein [Bacteroides cellulosilyticus]MBV3637763.1 hypothetical protein [Bacteroides cellulosilyticus]MBV3664104.1 hypothetical protein [Bacteroides cellulosilyticus]MBV3694683.1 hypothetical protein [Bacteroides cellulosilyticus]MBV3735087.1 hypothetical protein [Bacteroides cellulosilyticus]MBV3745533.1 hypothetical protein [Bacteroides cellulosilyticus]
MKKSNAELTPLMKNNFFVVVFLLSFPFLLPIPDSLCRLCCSRHTIYDTDDGQILVFTVSHTTYNTLIYSILKYFFIAETNVSTKRNERSH